MPIEFNCPSCGKAIRTPDDSAGKQGKCPNCGSVMQIPAGGFPSAPTAGQPSPPAQNDLFGSPTANTFGGTPAPQPTPGGGAPAGSGFGGGGAGGFSDQANPYATPYASGGPVSPAAAKAADKVKAPAIAIIVTAVLNILMFLGYGIVNSMIAPGIDLPPVKNEAEAAGQKIGFAIGVSMPFLAIIPSAVAVWGAFNMMNLKSRGAAMTGAICMVVPCCGCLAFPFGIWALVVMADADVKRAFG